MSKSDAQILVEGRAVEHHKAELLAAFTVLNAAIALAANDGIEVEIIHNVQHGVDGPPRPYLSASLKTAIR